MTGTGGDAHAAFTEKMFSILDRNFSPTVPAATKRSAGLDPQHGLIVGATLRPGVVNDLAQSLKQLPDVWSAYDADSIHCTFGAADETLPEVSMAAATAHGDLTSGVQLVLSDMLFDEPSLVNTRLLVSGDTIVLAGELNPEAFLLRQTLLDEQDDDSPFPVKPGWGCHLTLARATRELTDEEHEATDLWLHENSVQPSVVSLTHALIGAFVVTDDRFRFDPKYRSAIGIIHV